MFKGKAWKWLLLGSAFTIIVVYLLELTTNGIERVNGPMQANQPYELQLNPAYVKSTNNEEALEEIAPTPNIDPSLSPIEQEISSLEYEIAQLKKQALEQEKERLQTELLLNESAAQPAVNQLADKTSGVLQEASASGLKYVAQLFSKMIN